MSNQVVPVIPKRNATTGAGYPTSLVLGELAVNTTTGDVFLGADPGVVQVGVALAAGTYLTIGVGNGTETQFEFAGGSGNAAGGYLVSVGGIDQPSGWTVDSGILTFSEAPPVGAEVSIRAILKGLGGGGGSSNATQLQGRNISSTAPTNGQFLMWSAANNQWEPVSLHDSVTFDTEGVHTWTVPLWIETISIAANAANGEDGTAGQNGGSGYYGTSSSGGGPGGDPYVPATTGANGADGLDGVDGQAGKNITISGPDISIDLVGGAGGQKGLGGYGGGGGGGAGNGYFCSGSTNGATGNGPLGGAGGNGCGAGGGGGPGQPGQAGGFDGQRWSGNGGNGGDACGADGAPGAGGAGTTGTAGSVGDSYSQTSFQVAGGATIQVTISSGAGTASCTITW